jgi:hypothetical protein
MRLCGAGTKRKSAVFESPDSPVHRQRTGPSAAAAYEAETRFVSVEPPAGVDWATAFRRGREAEQFLDIALVVAGQMIRTHKMVIASFSPYLAGLLTSGLAESSSCGNEMPIGDENIDGDAVAAIVDCFYSGRIGLSSATVSTIIRTANVLQVDVVEKVANKFFVEALEPQTATDALGYTAQFCECGELARELHENCLQYVRDRFTECAASTSFLELPIEMVLQLIGSAKLPAPEEEVLAAARAWFEHDVSSRKGVLKKLVPLIRWPLLPPALRLGMDREQLLLQCGDVPLALRMMKEISSEFAASDEAVDCPRLKPRLCQTFTFQRIDNSVSGQGKFDQQGVICRISTEGGSWTNSHLAGRLHVAFSSVAYGQPGDLVSKYNAKPTRVYTRDVTNSWMQVDLGPKRVLAATYYALRNNHARTNVLRNWELQAANTEVGPWVTLRRHDNDPSIQLDAPGFVAAWSMDNELTFRFFRIYQHGRNAGGTNHLNCGGIELYGRLYCRP